MLKSILLASGRHQRPKGRSRLRSTEKTNRMRLTRMLFTALMALLFVFPAKPVLADNPPPPPAGSPFDIKVFLQGFYLEDGMMRQAHEDKGGGLLEPKWKGTEIADKVTIELHKPGHYGVVSETFIYSDENLLTNGVIQANLPDLGEYYITIRTRNHLETVSASPIDFGTATRTFAEGGGYDFTTSAAQAYGSNQADLGAGVFGMYLGDVNQDGFVDISDLSPVIFELRGFTEGYVVEDMNGDGFVDISDLSPVIFNLRAFIERVIPPNE